LVQANDGAIYGTSLFNVIFKTVLNPALRNRRRVTPTTRNFWIIAILCLAGVEGLSGCGGSSNTARAGTYTIPITLTLAGGAAQNISATVIVE